MKLYELAENYNELLALLDNEEATAEDLADTLDAIEEDFNCKINSICKLMRNLEADEKAFKEEATRLSDCAKRAKEKREYLKEYVDVTLKSVGLKKVETELFKLSYRKSKAVNITSFEELPDDFLKVTTTIDKAGIRKALTEGEEVAGAELVENTNLQIKVGR